MIGVAVVGAGHWGPNLIRNFQGPPTSAVRWVVDRDAGRLAQVVSRFPEVRVDAEVDAALADPEVDAVVVATPTTTHFGLAERALRAGKHVLVEKPITTSVEEGERLCELATAGGLILMVGHVFVYNAGVERVRAYLREGALGRVYYVSMVRTNLGPIRLDVNAAWDLAAHDISIANYWLDAEPLSVSAQGGRWINDGLEDAVFATFRYPGDVLVNLHSSWLNPRKARDITVVGDRSMLTLDDMNLNEPLRIYDKGVTDERVTPGFVDTFASFRASVREGAITIPKVSLGEPLRAECEHFLDCVASGRPPLTGGREGVAVVRALTALERSLDNDGRAEPVVPVPLGSEV
ncbi:MAG TPA: Gfo/Idh/MocA family oxidoreductase [Acidimicrobiales bacterium]|nr:Gfo/Idh/MocA family oxidoreductase [Acidimicrobiales bacterium]